jgi:hypothetical protein
MAIALHLDTAHPDTGIFRDEIVRLKTRYRSLWWECDSGTPILGNPVSRREQRSNETATKRLMDEVASCVQEYPEDDQERHRWRRSLRQRIQSFGERRLGWPRGYRDLLLGDEFFNSSTAFVRLARAFDPGIPMEEVGQALRNVWIVNSLQMLLQRPVELSPAVYAYSMLYPLTDNFLDAPNVSSEEKRAFADRLESRLLGQTPPVSSPREEAVWRLVDLIEDQYPRALYPDLYSSLLAIHRAQGRSLCQHNGIRGPFEEDLLDISFEKGGTSVLADGYLAAGDLPPAHAQFCFAYGVFLQLLDDLQDVREDQESRHRTIFTQTAAAWPLDRLASRLYHFIDRCLDLSPFAGPRHAQELDLIRRNCRSLLVGAVAENPSLFGRRFRRSLESASPLSFRAQSRLRRYAVKKRKQTARSLQRRRGVESLLDLLDRDLG